MKGLSRYGSKVRRAARASVMARRREKAARKEQRAFARAWHSESVQQILHNTGADTIGAYVRVLVGDWVWRRHAAHRC